MGDTRYTGMVERWFEMRGYGWLLPDNPAVSSRALFCHAKGLLGGRKHLNAGDQVEFSIGVTERGPRCVEVRVVTPAPGEG